jgi:hypothetical protein
MISRRELNFSQLILTHNTRVYLTSDFGEIIREECERRTSTVTLLSRITITSSVHVCCRLNDPSYICSANISAMSSWRGYYFSHFLVSRLVRFDCSRFARYISRGSSGVDRVTISGEIREQGAIEGAGNESVHYREDDSMWE